MVHLVGLMILMMMVISSSQELLKMSVYKMSEMYAPLE
jgi:hypothetical protein